MNKNILIVIVVIIALALAGVGIYFVVKNSSNQQKSQELIKAQAEIDAVGVSIPDLNFSQSPLPDLNVSSLNVATPNLNTGVNNFSMPSVNTDFTFDASSIDIAVPSASSYNIKMPSIPNGGYGQGAPQNIPTGQGPTGQGSTGGAQQGKAPAVDCSQFASVPSCSMTGPGEAMCKQCFPNK